MKTALTKKVTVGLITPYKGLQEVPLIRNKIKPIAPKKYDDIQKLLK